MRRVLLLATVIAGTAALWACGSLSPLELAPPGECHADTQCKGERICVGGQCVWPDQVDGGRDAGPKPGVDAGPTPVPDAGPLPQPDGGPRPPPDGGPLPPPDGGPTPPPDGGSGPPPGQVGAACQSNTDCTDPGAFCFNQFPGGYCIIPGCGNGTCPQGSTCLANPNGNACVQSCASDGDCRTGYICSSAYGPSICIPATGGGTTPVGGACTQPSDCAGVSGLCVTQWPNGYCITTDCHTRPCAAGSQCVDTGGNALCLASCNASGDCGRPAYVCQPINAAGGGVCIPNCNQAKVCGQGQTCNTSTGLCQ